MSLDRYATEGHLRIRLASKHVHSSTYGNVVDYAFGGCAVNTLRRFSQTSVGDCAASMGLHRPFCL